MFILLFIALLLTSCSSIEKKTEVIKSMKTEEEQKDITPYLALQKLKDGNQRFLTNTQRERNLASQVISSKKQFPFAVILNCMDSRGSPEIIFDQGIGDIFVERLAGNISNLDIIGGMEYGTKIVGAKLIVVMGHTLCGAVKGACNNAKLGNLTQLLDKIQPAVMRAKKSTHISDCESSDLIDSIAYYNVLETIKDIKRDSPVLNKLIKQGKIAIVGAMHDLGTGKVTFFEER